MIQVKIEGLDRISEMLDPKVFRKSVSRALNDASRKGRTASTRSILDKWNIKSRDLKKRVTITSRASMRDLSVTLQATGRPMSLSYFNATWTRGNVHQTRTKGWKTKRAGRHQGVRVKILRDQPATVLPHSFLARVTAGKSNSHIGVFKRSGKSRLPIYERKVITVPSMWRQAAPQRELSEKVTQAFGLRLRHHLDFLK